MEVSSFRHPALPGRSASAGLLRLASDERLIALTRRGHQRAFEAIVHRYRARLLAFCRHLLGSREDAEDVLQEVFVAAFNAIVADERPINVRPWLYRIARNRCLNQLRRATATGVDSMDVFLADHGQSVSERILQREQFRSLLADIRTLPETQRTALLLREIDALPYEQIADVMDTTVPSVKSLLVRARVALAEAAEARALSCEEVREQLGEEAEGLTKLAAPVRRHLRSCDRCRAFRKQLKHNERVLGAVLPVGFFALAQRLILGHLSSTTAGGAGGAYASGSAGAAGGAVAGATASAGGIAGFGSFASLGGGAIATKAVAGLAAAALITAGAVAAERTIHSAPAKRAPQSRRLAASRPAAPAPLLASIANPRIQPRGVRHGRRGQGPRAAAVTDRRQAKPKQAGCAGAPAGASAGRSAAGTAPPASALDAKRASAHASPAATRPAAACTAPGKGPKGSAPGLAAAAAGGRTPGTQLASTQSASSTSSSSASSSSATSSSSSSTAQSTATASTRAAHGSSGAGARSSSTAGGAETIEVITSTSELPAPAEASQAGGGDMQPTGGAEASFGSDPPLDSGGTPAPPQLQAAAATPPQQQASAAPTGG